MFKRTMLREDTEPGAVSSAVHHAIIYAVGEKLFLPGTDGTRLAAIDFILPSKDFRPRKEAAQFGNDFRRGNQFRHQRTRSCAELSRGERFEFPIGMLFVNLSKLEVRN